MKVLLVDDNESVRFSIGALLEDAGHEVIEASSLWAARQWISRDYDLAIIDVDLGDGIGTDLIAEIRRERPGAAVVIMSGGGFAPGMEAADLMLTKGDDPEDWIRRLERTVTVKRTG